MLRNAYIRRMSANRMVLIVTPRGDVRDRNPDRRGCYLIDWVPHPSDKFSVEAGEPREAGIERHVRQNFRAIFKNEVAQLYGEAWQAHFPADFYNDYVLFRDCFACEALDIGWDFAKETFAQHKY
ncbi:MAG: hypothetical protein HQL34_10975 [Alphaproteobacteria bacterium]|nr:hypothetical protein [Alphaproteobacteria bacterium]